MARTTVKQETQQEEKFSGKLRIIPYQDSRGKTRIMKNGFCTITAPLSKDPHNLSNGYKVGFTREQFDKMYQGPLTFDQYLDKFKITLQDGTKKLDMSDPNDRLVYETIKFHPYIANSEDDLKNKPEARYIIIDDEKQARKKVTEAQRKITAYKIYGSLMPSDKRDCLYLYSLNGMDMSDDQADFRLLEMIERDPAAFTEKYEDQQREDKVFVYKMIHGHVLIKRKNQLYFDETYVGRTVEDVVDMLDKPENNLLKQDMMKRFTNNMSK
jgi:hypothetical protein